jgi:hypothetical protein
MISLWKSKSWIIFLIPTRRVGLLRASITALKRNATHLERGAENDSKLNPISQCVNAV